MVSVDVKHHVYVGNGCKVNRQGPEFGLRQRGELEDFRLTDTMACQAMGVKRTVSQFRASVSELRSCMNREVGLGFHFLFPSSPVTWCLTSTETMRLIRDGEKGNTYGGR